MDFSNGEQTRNIFLKLFHFFKNCWWCAFNVEGKKRTTWESGEDDLPNWDEVSFNQETGTLTVNCIGLNSLYALDAWCLAQIADVLDRNEDYESYLSEYETMKELINTHLWNDKEGFYFDRHWDGRFSSKKAASNFEPQNCCWLPDPEHCR